MDSQQLRAVAEKCIVYAQGAVGAVGAIAARGQVPQSPEVLLHELQVHQFELETQNEELRHAQNELEASRDRFADFYESAPVGYLTLSEKGLIDGLNLTAAELLGVKRNQLLHKRFAHYVMPEDADRWYAYFMGALNRNEKMKCEVAVRRADGFVHVRLDSLRLVKAGQPTTLRVVMTDITEQKIAALELERHRHHLEELVAERTRALSEAKVAAESASRAKTAFLHNVSHEFRTPLHAITGMSHLLRRSGVTAQQADRLDKIDAASKHLLEFVNAVIDYSRFEAGMLKLDETDFTLSGLIHDVVSVTGDAVRGKGLDLQIKIGDAPQALHGDQGRLRQALLNYLNNAIKFTEHGSITLSCKMIEEGESGYLLRFEVSDTGIGIAPDDYDRLFNTFEQVDNSSTRKYSGTGLGLALTKKLAMLMGGEAGFSSMPGDGSTFWFTARLSKVSPTPTSTA